MLANISDIPIAKISVLGKLYESGYRQKPQSVNVANAHTASATIAMMNFIRPNITELTC